MSAAALSPGTVRNIARFIAFRVFFNARWYYPVMGVLFLDLGVPLEQFALLNVMWAISIVCLEIPSGAVADLIGRKRIVVLAAACMVVELALLAFAPSGSPLLFPMLLLNRFLSGMAEACASGADESLVYDSLKAESQEALWPTVLARLMRWQSAGFFVAMLLGSVVYDAAVVSRILDWFGLPWHLAQTTTLRFPLYLTLANAVCALLATLGLREPPVASAPAALQPGEAWRQVLATARWIGHTHRVLFVVLAGLCLDSVIRLFLTLGSNYYRLVQLPTAAFGLMGAGMAVLGFIAAPLGQHLVHRRELRTNFTLAGLLALLGLTIAALALPLWGVLAVVPVGIAMSLLGFFLSHYLNVLVADSSRRATVLSFKGVALNLAYGAAGLLFAAYTTARQHTGDANHVFAEALRWLPVWVVCVLLFLTLAGRRLARSPLTSEPGAEA